MGKLVKTSFKSNNHILAKRPIKLLHIDLFGPTKNKSLSGNRYVFAIVDDFIRYIMVLFLKSKNETIYEFVKFSNKIDVDQMFKFFFFQFHHQTLFFMRLHPFLAKLKGN